MVFIVPIIMGKSYRSLFILYEEYQKTTLVFEWYNQYRPNIYSR